MQEGIWPLSSPEGLIKNAGNGYNPIQGWLDAVYYCGHTEYTARGLAAYGYVHRVTCVSSHVMLSNLDSG